MSSAAPPATSPAPSTPPFSRERRCQATACGAGVCAVIGAHSASSYAVTQRPAAPGAGLDPPPGAASGVGEDAAQDLDQPVVPGLGRLHQPPRGAVCELVQPTADALRDDRPQVLGN